MSFPLSFILSSLSLDVCRETRVSPCGYDGKTAQDRESSRGNEHVTGMTPRDTRSDTRVSCHFEFNTATMSKLSFVATTPRGPRTTQEKYPITNRTEGLLREPQNTWSHGPHSQTCPHCTCSRESRLTALSREKKIHSVLSSHSPDWRGTKARVIFSVGARGSVTGAGVVRGRRGPYR